MAYVPAEDYELGQESKMKYPIHILEEKLVRDIDGKLTVKKLVGKLMGEYTFPNIMMLTRKRIMENIDTEDLVDILKKTSKS